MKGMKTSIVAAAAALALSGCASIFNGTTQAVVIQSEPDGAAITVVNRAGEKIHAGTTPATVTLNRGAGYFKSETYTVTFTKPGYATKEVTVSGSMSGWYIGNLLFGGLIGMLAVDPATGAMYTLPDSVQGKLLETDAPKVSDGSQKLTIVTTDALTTAQMANARLLDAAK